MAKKRESKRQLRIQKALRREYGEELFVFKVHGNPFQRSGIPDLIGCVYGLMFAFEIKEPDGSPSQIQLETISDIRKSGGIAHVIEEDDEALWILKAAIALIKRRAVDPENEECWEFDNPNRYGYGRLRIANKLWTAHRAAYIVWKGHIPEGFHVCHSCDNRRCFNPNHLWLGTDQDNVNDCKNKGRRANLKGEAHGMAKLTKREVIEIRLKRESGVSLKYLSSVYGVSVSQINSICKRRTWAHVED